RTGHRLLRGHTAARALSDLRSAGDHEAAPHANRRTRGAGRGPRAPSNRLTARGLVFGRRPEIRSIQAMSDPRHDPGTERAKARADAHSFSRRFMIGTADVRVGTAGWTDRTLTARGVFYPDDAKTPEDRLRYYSSRFALVEADMGFYAI